MFIQADKSPPSLNDQIIINYPSLTRVSTLNSLGSIQPDLQVYKYERAVFVSDELSLDQ